MGAWLAFLDESGVSQRPSVRRSWGRKGCTPVIAGTGSWKKRTVTALILCDPEGKKPRLLFRISPKNADVAETLHSLAHLKRHVRRPVILLWDGLPAHRSKAVRDYLKQEQSWLSVERFPAYAPELNPAEYLWASVKRRDLGNYCPERMEDMDGAIRRAVRRIRKHPGILAGCVRASGLFVH